MIKNDLKSVQPEDTSLNGIYRGVVEDNFSDPDKSGKCKVRVFGVHTENKKKSELDGIPTQELPWAEPAMGLFEGSVTGFGCWTIPLQGSHVFLFFECGDPQEPRYFATVPGIPKDQNHGLEDKQGFSDPDKKYPIEKIKKPHNPNAVGEPDFHKLGRGESKDTIVDSKSKKKDTGVSTVEGEKWDEPDPYYAGKYPDNKVFATRSGITVEIDDTEESERIHVYHPSNTYVEINKEGNIVLRNANDKFEIVDNDKKEHVANNYDRTVDTDRTSKVGSNETEEIGKDRTITISGNDELTVKGDLNIAVDGDASVTSSGSVAVEGSGGITITDTTGVTLNEGTGQILTTNDLCQYTGTPHTKVNSSSVCKAP